MNRVALLSTANNYKSVSRGVLNDDYLKKWKEYKTTWKSNPDNNYTIDANFLMKYFECHNDCEKSGRCNATLGSISWRQHAKTTSYRDTVRGHEGIKNLLTSDDDQSLQSLIIIGDVCPYLICVLGLAFNIEAGFWAKYLGGRELAQTESVDPWLRLPVTQNPVQERHLFHLSTIEAREISSGNILDWKHDGRADPLKRLEHDSVPWRTRKVTILPERRSYDGSLIWRSVAFVHKRISIWCPMDGPRRGKLTQGQMGKNEAT